MFNTDINSDYWLCLWLKLGSLLFTMTNLDKFCCRNFKEGTAFKVSGIL